MWDSVKFFKRIFLSKYKAYKNYLYYLNRLVIPNYNKLKFKLLKYIYNILVTSYLG